MQVSWSCVLLCPLRWELWQIPVETAGIRACWMAISHIRDTSCPTPLTWNQFVEMKYFKLLLFIFLSIHLLPLNLGSGHGGSRLSEAQTSLWTANCPAHPGESHGEARPAENCCPSSMSWISLWISSHLWGELLNKTLGPLNSSLNSMVLDLETLIFTRLLTAPVKAVGHGVMKPQNHIVCKRRILKLLTN